jgi:hypothetical protein
MTSYRELENFFPCNVCRNVFSSQNFNIPENGTLREEHRLRVFENRVLRRIFGPKR